ncbi:PAS sensor protein [Gemmatirosa kalamazoonensis]|uniref:histidine kinase n=1 Tax=Gemmatirosa kalamazoonensis TaxID=861299 RepID=W0RH86_9BACT|nr:ATP-binding protein [Gemmatirosa kalamazoonensis]AHG88753.1 PAS sensor protein [Gemmatirosa kalamazoonensis]
MAPHESRSTPISEPDDDERERHDERRAANRRDIDRRVTAVIEGMSDAFLALDAEWRITYANREVARLNGVTSAQLVGRVHWDVWPETVGSEVERQYRRVVAERVPVQFEHYYEDADVWHDIRAYPADDGGLAVFYRDVSAQKRLEGERVERVREVADAHERALAAEVQFRLLVERVRDYAVFLLDPDGIVTQWGQGAERITGWTAGQAIGEHLRFLYPDGGSAEDGTPAEHLAHAAAHGEYIGEGMRVRRGGAAFPARVVLTALRRGGQLVGFSNIAQDLTGEREREAALSHAMAAAEAANTAKSQFLANTSHEIRTPLNAVIGYAELLALGMGGALTDQARRYVERIQATSRHLLGIVNDVLDLAKIEAGQMHTAREPGLVAPAIAAALQIVEEQARARAVAVTNACGREPRAFFGDNERVRQILVNLLSNAVRFTEAGGRVTVTCGSGPRPGARTPAVPEPATGWTFIKVEDTGIGIASEQLDKVWEAFEQADASRTRKFGGSGLGLTISRHLARLMGGEITVRSEPGLGSSFVLWLPAADPAEVGPGGSTAPEPVPSVAVAETDPMAALSDVTPTDAAGLAHISEALVSETERILATYAARLRADLGTPHAHGQADAQLEDHGSTFLVDVAQCLLVIGQDGPEAAEMLRDGSAIQHLIAARHGAQRARLGWQESEMRREYAILREEIHAAVRRSRRAEATAEERAIEVINHMLARAEEESITILRVTTAG